MGNFFVVVSSKNHKDESNRLFRLGLQIAHQAKDQEPSRTLQTGWVHAASFGRQNGSGTPIVNDLETESWLLSIGTWFHDEDYGSGAESRLLRRYLKVGPIQTAKELEGFFVIVIGDGRTSETFLITDIVGSCHCFLRDFNYAIALAGSSLLLAGLEDFSLDITGCQEFLSTGTIYEDRTIYREVRKLSPATVFRFTDGSLKNHQRYWQVADIPFDSLDDQLSVSGLWETLVRSAQKIESIFPHPVCDLTGGYDSRALVAAFLTADVQFSTTISGPMESSDVVVSQGLARVIGKPHLYVQPQELVSFKQVKKAFQFTDGEFDLLEYARILCVHQILSERFDISINGSFGGIARALWWELLYPRVGANSKLDSEKLARRRYAPQNFDTALFPPETRLDFVKHFTGVIERINAGLYELPNTIQMDHANLLMRIQRWQGRIASSTNQLWPCLSPFGLRSVLELLFKTKTNLRLRSLLIRRMLTEYQPRLAEYPLDRGYPAMPVTLKTLHRFSPMPAHLGKRVLSKLIRMLKRNWEPPTSRPGMLPVRLQLWDEEETRGLLQGEPMRLECLVDTSALADFLNRSRERNFPYSDQWARVLSLEYTLRVLDNVKTG